MPSEQDLDEPVDLPLSIAALTETPGYEGQIEHREAIPAREGRYVDPEAALPPALARAFQDHVGDLYAHQAAGLRHLADGENVVVTTDTASGKTYVYALEIARRRAQNPDATALLVYPTKALSRDQERELNDFFEALGVDAAVRVYDGDTPTDRRPRIRETADVLITNFVGLNVYLAHHRRWSRFFGDLSLAVIDEAHAYTGVHGMHVAWTVRRLRRLLADYGSRPQFVCTSATIGNPAEHAERLTGLPFAVVDEDGSPSGRRELAFWKPPLDERALGPDADFEDFRAAQTNPIREGSAVLAHLGSHGYQTLLFTRSRKGAELGARYARTAAEKHAAGDLSVQPYHAGLGNETRRGTEYQLKSGALDGVTATTALELGIDVGSMDATVLTGYPGTRQSFWQQIGRSGRDTRTALSVYVAGGDAIDQYVLENPDHVLGEPIEDAVVGLENNPVYAQHVLAAAHERPLEASDREYFDGERLDRAVEMWRDAGRLDGDLERAVRYTGSPRPQADISMYTTGGRDFQVRCENGEIDMEPVSRERAYRDHHEGALFLHAGQQYEVVGFEESGANPTITVRAVDVEAYTETHSTKSVRDVEPEAVRDLGDGYRLAWGSGTVEVHYHAYQRKAIGSNRTNGEPRPTGLPPIDLETQLVWLELPKGSGAGVLEAVSGEPAGSLSERERVEIFGGGLHGAEHGMIKLTPLELRMDTADLGGLSTPRHEETGVPTWFIHDAVEGGLGFSKRIYERFEAVARRTRDRVAACDCQGSNGCPACIMDAQCGNQNRPLHTRATVEILARVLERL